MIICLSVSHKNASLRMLETLNVPREADAIKALHREDVAQECLVLQTCNRVEIYCVVQDTNKEYAVNQVLKYWSLRTGVSMDTTRKIFQLYEGREALLHLFYLVAGLESMVIGEDQILGQVRTAYVKCKKLGGVGCILDRIFMKAVNTGRRIRTETKINEGSVSVSSVAVDLFAKEHGDLSLVKAFVIGAGEAGSIAAETLQRRGVKNILISNRTFERSVELAKKVDGKAIALESLYDVLSDVDFVIVAVSVNQPLIRASEIERVLAKSARSKPLWITDISQPRAVEENVAKIQGVILKNIIHLKEMVDENLRIRNGEAKRVKDMISGELALLEDQLLRLIVQPIISEIHRKMDLIRKAELKRAISKSHISENDKIAVIDRFSRELVERILQIPTEQLNVAAMNGDNQLILAAQALFEVNKRCKSEQGDQAKENP
jgi:glutamyl-tRNA reductase